MDLSDNFRKALDEVGANSSGGAPFLFCYGATLLVSVFLPRPTAPLTLRHARKLLLTAV
jgi:hypothetical protein